MTPTSILLLPAPEHREALLGASPGGGRAPMAFDWVCGGQHFADGHLSGEPVALGWALGEAPSHRPTPTTWCHNAKFPRGCSVPGSSVVNSGAVALILRWHGEDDPMGIERLLHVMRSRPIAYAGLESVLAAFAVERFGRVIYLDADGREVSP